VTSKDTTHLGRNLLTISWIYQEKVVAFVWCRLEDGINKYINRDNNFENGPPITGASGDDKLLFVIQDREQKIYTAIVANATALCSSRCVVK